MNSVILIGNDQEDADKIHWAATYSLNSSAVSSFRSQQRWKGWISFHSLSRFFFFFFFLHGTFLEIGLFSSSIPSWRFRKTHSFAVCHLMSHFKHLEWCFDENHTTNPLPTHIVSVGHKLSRETAATWAIHRDLMIRRHLLLLLSPRASELTSGWTGEGAGTGSQTTHQAVPVPLMIISWSF